MGMMSVTDRKHGQDGSAGAAAAAEPAPAIGKHTLVESVMAKMGPGPVQKKPAAEIEADRLADLVNRGAATDPASTAPVVFPAPKGATPQQRHDAAAARLQLIETSIAAEDGMPADRRSEQTKDDA